ncbi:MAG: hypothetical protein H6R13_3014 [Proteobacteria bacterium]|nr:hypothetical protein [Pseudomonadota bacterium]
MEQSTNAKTVITNELKTEAESLLLQHCKMRLSEPLLEAKMALDAFESSQVRRVPYRAPVDSPWIADMMRAAVMPDNTVCMRTVRSHAVSHGELMAIHTGPTESSLELRKAMEADNCIWGYYGSPDEDEEAHYYAEVTGYGLAKYLGIDLHNFMSEQYPAYQQPA